MARLLNRGKEQGRSDDNEETINKRLAIYNSQTAPLIDWYKNEGLHHYVKSYGVLEEIFADVCKIIDEL